MCRALQERGIEPLIACTDADGAGRLTVELGQPLVYKGVRAVFFSRPRSEPASTFTRRPRTLHCNDAFSSHPCYFLAYTL
jgi:hypothetical protein